MTVEGNNEADRLADLGRLSNPLHHVLHTPNAPFDPTSPLATPIKKARSIAALHYESADVSRCIEFQSPAFVRFSSIIANDILRSLDLEPLSDSDQSATLSDYSYSDTVIVDEDSDDDSAYSTDVSDTRIRRRSL